MNRISRDQMFMGICEVIAQRSTCSRQNVGCLVVTKNHNILSMGYNGPPSGENHCQGKSCPLHNGGCVRSLHAEKNALDRIPSLSLKELTLYTTLSPCVDCAIHIFNYPINRVVFRNDYRLSSGRELLNERKIKVHRLTPSGYLLDPFTNELIETQP